MAFMLQCLMGHFLLAFAFYATHRWVLHGKVGTLKFFRPLMLQHRMHHKKPRDPGGFLFTPGWNALLLFAIFFTLILSPPMGLGFLSYALLYSWRHKRAHEGASGKIARHHHDHHFKNPLKNFDIVYPFIDKLFRTTRTS